MSVSETFQAEFCSYFTYKLTLDYQEIYQQGIDDGPFTYKYSCLYFSVKYYYYNNRYLSNLNTIQTNMIKYNRDYN